MLAFLFLEAWLVLPSRKPGVNDLESAPAGG